MSRYERRQVRRAFGAVLKTTRRELGMTQDRLAEICKVDRTYPSLLERGGRHPTLWMLLLIAEGLGVEPQKLVTDTLTRLKEETP